MTPEDRIRAELEFAGFEVAKIDSRAIVCRRPNAPDLCVMRWRGSPIEEIVTTARRFAAWQAERAV